MALRPKRDFVTDPDLVYVATAGRGLAPLTSPDAVARYFESRVGIGSNLAADRDACKVELAAFMGVEPADIALVGSTSDGINLVYSVVDWQRGDNVVVTTGDLEFPSVVLSAFSLAPLGVEVRVVSHRDWMVEPGAIGEVVDERTRLVFVSHVSYRTGYKFDLHAVDSAIKARADAIVAVDVSQSLGVTSIDFNCCDFAVSTAFKWLLGAHGVAPLFWNRARCPGARPAWVGWHSVEDDLARPIQFKSDAERFEVGNPGYLPDYALREGIRVLANIGLAKIEAHARDLGGTAADGIGLARVARDHPAGSRPPSRHRLLGGPGVRGHRSESA